MDQWSGTNFTKLLCLFLVGIPAVTGAFMHQSGKMWPILTIGFGVYALILCLELPLYLDTGSSLDSDSSVAALYVFTWFCFRNRFQDVIFTGLVSQHNNELWRVDQLPYWICDFYGTFSGFIIYLSELFQIFGSPKVALVAIGIASGIVFPLGVGYFTSAITANSKMLLLQPLSLQSVNLEFD